MTELLDAVTIDPADGETDGVVLWLHGLGADGHDFEPIVPMLEAPHLRFVFPHAPEIPVTRKLRILETVDVADRLRELATTPVPLATAIVDLRMDATAAAAAFSIAARSARASSSSAWLQNRSR